MRYIAIFILLLPAVHALNIDLSVEKVFVGEVKSFVYNDSFAVKQFSGEFLNPGSVPYSARARVDVFEDDNIVFTAWSEKMVLMPGNTAPFRLSWVPEEGGDYTARLRAYYGGEIVENTMNLSVSAKEVKKTVSINNVRVFDNLVLVELTSEKDKDEIYVVPSGFPRDWIFTQGMIGGIKANERRLVLLSYIPSVWTPQNITIYAGSGDAVKAKSLVMERETGLTALLYRILYGFSFGQ